MKYLLFQLFLICIFVFPAWTEMPESPMDVPVEDVLNSPELKAVGYPFDNIKIPPSPEPQIKEYMEKYHPDLDYKKFVFEPYCPLAEVGKCIVYLYRSGQMAEEKQAETLDKIFKNCTHFESHSSPFSKPWRSSQIVSATFAVGDFQANMNMLTAALTLTAHTGAIRDIVLLLKFNDFCIDDNNAIRFNSLVRSGGNPFIDMKSPREPLLKLWPAQDAIVSHATTTVPLLRKAAVDESLPLPLRIKAVEYLLYLDPEILRLDLWHSCDRLFLEELMKVNFPRFSWKKSEPDEGKSIKEIRDQNHRLLLFKKKIRGDLDRLIEEENHQQ